MKPLSVLSLATTFAFLAFVLPSLAQQVPNPQSGRIVEVGIPIAVIDEQKILRDSSAMKNIREQVNKYGSTFEKELEKERAKIRSTNQELVRQRTILSAEAFAEKRRLFEQKVISVQQLVQQRQSGLDTSRNKARAKVNKVYREITAKLAEENNLAIILRKSQTVLIIDTLDVTKEVLLRLNENLPKVKVDKPGSKVAKPEK